MLKCVLVIPTATPPVPTSHSTTGLMPPRAAAACALAVRYGRRRHHLPVFALDNAAITFRLL